MSGEGTTMYATTLVRFVRLAEALA